MRRCRRFSGILPRKIEKPDVDGTTQNSCSQKCLKESFESVPVLLLRIVLQELWIKRAVIPQQAQIPMRNEWDQGYLNEDN